MGNWGEREGEGVGVSARRVLMMAGKSLSGDSRKDWWGPLGIRLDVRLGIKIACWIRRPD